MARKKSGLYDNKKYQNDYHKGLKRFLISFNPRNPEDMKIWDYLFSKENKTGFIKGLLRYWMDCEEDLEESRMRFESRDQKTEEKEEIRISFPAVDGYKDLEALEECSREQHDICVAREGQWEVRVDLNTRKVLTVNSLIPVIDPDTI